MIEAVPVVPGAQLRRVVIPANAGVVAAAAVLGRAVQPLPPVEVATTDVQLLQIFLLFFVTVNRIRI